jgi:hypothetical protein
MELVYKVVYVLKDLFLEAICTVPLNIKLLNLQS